MTMIQTDNRLPSRRTMVNAWQRKDPQFEGVFFVAVKTTGIFCRPVCRVKPALPRNVEFFGTAAQAMYHGYRACKLCRPLDAGRKPPEVVRRLMKRIEQSPATRLRERDLCDMGIDPSTARRQFRAYCRMTFAQYQRARRMGLALRGVRAGHCVVDAQLDAGFESASGFREAFSRLFGTPARNSEDVPILTSQWMPTPLGPMLAIAGDDGVVLFDFADRKGLERAILRLRSRHAIATGRSAVIVPGGHPHLAQLAREIGEYFAGARQSFRVPLAPKGSPFERAAWDYLRSTEFGQTRTYLEEARSLGNPRAVRAVGRANGMNYIAILIPCHRVIASSGDLAGYGGGLARKRWLIDHEQRHAMPAAIERDRRGELDLNRSPATFHPIGV